VCEEELMRIPALNPTIETSSTATDSDSLDAVIGGAGWSPVSTDPQPTITVW
jgi:hypothetical protein